MEKSDTKRKNPLQIGHCDFLILRSDIIHHLRPPQLISLRCSPVPLRPDVQIVFEVFCAEK